MGIGLVHMGAKDGQSGFSIKSVIKSKNQEKGCSKREHWVVALLLHTAHKTRRCWQEKRYEEHASTVGDLLGTLLASFGHGLAGSTG